MRTRNLESFKTTMADQKINMDNGNDAVLPPKVPDTTATIASSSGSAVANAEQVIDVSETGANSEKKIKKKKKKKHKKKHKKRVGSGETEFSKRAAPPLLESFFGNEGGNSCSCGLTVCATQSDE